MSKNLLRYDLGPEVEAFSTMRDAELPYAVVQPHQTHDCVVAEVTDPATTREQLEGVDALMTDIPGLAIGVRTADCIPILLFDPVHKAVAAVHSGWRGTVQRIGSHAIECMAQRYGTRAQDLKAVIGPGIGPDSFQVGEEVVQAFAQAGFPMQEILSDHGPRQPLPNDLMNGGLHIDLWRANSWILEQAGIAPHSIQVAGICTYRRNDLFFSARHEGRFCGRIINVIKLNKA